MDRDERDQEKGERDAAGIGIGILIMMGLGALTGLVLGVIYP